MQILNLQPGTSGGYQSQPYTGAGGTYASLQPGGGMTVGSGAQAQGNLQPGGQIQNAFNSLSSNIQQPGGMQAAGSPLNSGPMDQVRSWQSGQMGTPPASSPMMQSQASGGSWNPWAQAQQQNQMAEQNRFGQMGQQMGQPNQMALQNQFGQMGQQMGQRSLFGSQNQMQPGGYAGQMQNMMGMRSPWGGMGMQSPWGGMGMRSPWGGSQMQSPWGGSQMQSPWGRPSFGQTNRLQW